MTPYEKALGDSAKEKLSQFSVRTGLRERWLSAASGKQRGEKTLCPILTQVAYGLLQHN